MASPGNVNMDIAVELFERGYAEDRIKEALRECNTLGAAIEWLGSSGHESEAKDLTESVGSVSSVRRRAVRKVASSEQEGAAAPTSAAIFSAASGDASPPLGECGTDGDGAGVVIEERDAAGWWNKAAALWQNTAARRLESVSDLGQQEVQTPCEMSESPQSLQTDSPEHHTAESSCVTISGVVDASFASSTAEQSLRQREGSPKKAESVVQRPPATPCSAITSPEAAASGVSDAGAGRRKSSTPVRPLSGSPVSPYTLRMNKVEETCGICCHDVPPYRAVRLGCTHGWYCAQCVLRHAEARLENGAAVVTCPECCTPIAERDLRKLLPPELIERLLSRSLESAVDSTPDLWACPTPNCPMRVALGEGEVPRLKCMICKKTSCLKCGVQPYHTQYTCEQFQAKRGISRKRKHDEGFSDLMKWIEETGTKQCPTCRMGVTKQNLKGQQTQYSECHKMLCRNCTTKFCFKCLAVLTETYSCGCTIDAHGFVNPHTGKRVNHLRGAAAGRGNGRGRGQAKAAPKQKARSR